MADAIDTGTLTYRFERTFEAAPARVFAAWTTPEEVTLWWDPTGTPLVACSIDLRPKGTFQFVNAGHSPPFEGTYLVVEKPNRLEFDAMGAHGTVELHAEKGGTRMVVSIRSPSKEHFEMFKKIGVNVGTAATLDNLVKRVG